MLHSIPPASVKVGMYVTKFGGNWLDHPFWFSRFVVKPKDVSRINQASIPYVVIDDERGASPELSDVDEQDQPAAAPEIVSDKPEPLVPVRPKPSRGFQIGKPKRRGPVFEPAQRENDRERARNLVDGSLATMRQTLSDVRLGRAVRLAEVTNLVDGIVGMVERNPRTLLEMLRLKKKDEYTYLHSVAVCSLMVNVARHLGRSETEVRDYGMAGLLHDIGKMGVDDEILNKPGSLSDPEFERVRQHPQFGYEMLQKTANVPEMALDVCLHHHERVDGRGYPHKLSGGDLSEPARLGAICDVYDALTSDRSYKSAWTPVETVAAMWSWEGQFDRELLFAFMQAMGIFPPGIVVELRSRRLGVVLDNSQRNSRPRILVFYALNGQTRIAPEEITVEDDFANDAIIAIADPEKFGLTMQECRPDAIRSDWDRTTVRQAVG